MSLSGKYDQIAGAYKDHLGRKPDMPGLEYWGSRVGDIGVDGAIQGIKDSPEAAMYRLTGTPRQTTAQQEQALMEQREGGPTGSTSVAEHLYAILDKDSPLNRQAETQGLQRAHQRGLLNSSMAVGAAQDAVTSNAIPIASQDAGFQQGLEMQRQGHLQTLASQGQQHRHQMENLRASASTNAWGVMANNMNQQSLVTQQAINDVQMNPDISEENKSQMIAQLLQMRDSDLEFQQSLYDSMQIYLRSSDIFPSL